MWLAVDENGEHIFQSKPEMNGAWYPDIWLGESLSYVDVPEGTIERILGHKLINGECIEITNYGE